MALTTEDIWLIIAIVLTSLIFLTIGLRGLGMGSGSERYIFRRKSAGKEIGYEDVDEGVSKLLKQMNYNGFKPSFILSIDAGGSIIAGYIAKQTAEVFETMIWPVFVEDGQGDRFEVISPLDVMGFREQKYDILIVTDVTRDWKKLSDIASHVKVNYFNARVHTLALVETRERFQMGSTAQPKSTHYGAFYRWPDEVSLPWDKAKEPKAGFLKRLFRRNKSAEAETSAAQEPREPKLISG